LAIDIYGIAYGIKNADGVLLGGSDMVNVQKNLSPEPLSITISGSKLTYIAWWFWGQVSWLRRQHIRVGSCSINRTWPDRCYRDNKVRIGVTAM